GPQGVRTPRVLAGGAGGRDAEATLAPLAPPARDPAGRRPARDASRPPGAGALPGLLPQRFLDRVRWPGPDGPAVGPADRARVCLPARARELNGRPRLLAGRLPPRFRLPRRHRPTVGRSGRGGVRLPARPSRG